MPISLCIEENWLKQTHSFSDKMSKVYFMSIGHLLQPHCQLTDGQSQEKEDDIKSKLRHLCEKLFEMLSVKYLKESTQKNLSSPFLSDKKTMVDNFDLFFGNLKPSIETFPKFIDCILKKTASDVDEFRWEIQDCVEKVVWDQFVYKDFVSKYEEEKLNFLVEHKKYLYHLFCVFNRFTTGLNNNKNIIRLKYPFNLLSK